MGRGYIRFVIALLLPIVAGTLADCSKSSTPPAASVNPIPMEAKPSSYTAPKLTGPAPTSLNEAYQNMEATYDAVSAPDWQEAKTRLAALNTSVNKLNADLTPMASANNLQAEVVSSKENMIAVDLISLSDAIRSNSREAAKRQCNRISIPLADLALMYPNQAVGELMRLKYYSRQFNIAATTDDAPLLQETADAISQNWSALRPAVESHGGMVEARHFNDLIRQMQTVRPPGQLGNDLQARIQEIQDVLKR